MAAGEDGSLWIGTQGGLTYYRNGLFRTYTTKNGLPDDGILALCTDGPDAVWIVAGATLARLDHGKFNVFEPGKEVPVTAARTVVKDSHGDIWVAGYSRVVKRTGGRFVVVLGPGWIRV